MTSSPPSASKPLEPMDIEQAIVELVAGNRVKVCAYPDVAVRLGRVLQRDHVGLAEVSRFVSADPALAGVVIRLANSATYQRAGAEIRQVSDAVGRIGLEAIHRVAIAAGIGKEVCKPGPLQVLRFRAWRWSVSAALLCQELAPRRLVEPGVAFLGGLLHGFGRSVALAAIEQVLETRPGSGALPVALWHSIVESRRREFGRIVALEWNLPALVNTVLLDEVSELEESPASRLIELCRLADRVVTTVEGGPGVTPAQLGSLPGFASTEEILFVTGIVERLPWAIEALLEDSELPASPQRARAISAVSYPASSLQGALRPIDFPVICAKANQPTEYRATHVANDGLAIVGPKPLQVNSIVRLELHRADVPLRVWVRVAQCEAIDRGYRIEVHPYALGRDDRVRWDDAVEA